MKDAKKACRKSPIMTLFTIIQTTIRKIMTPHIVFFLSIFIFFYPWFVSGATSI